MSSHVPELPEVETIVRELRPRVAGRTITAVTLHQSDVLRGVAAAALQRRLHGQPIVELARRAKHAVFSLRSGSRLVIQPRMTGTLIAYDRRLTAEEHRYAVLELELGSRRRLVYRDVRRLGTVSLLDGRAWSAYTESLGPEPLASDFSAADLARCLGRTKQAIKKALMDQRRLAGVGNIYANEILFTASIDPSRRVDALTPAEIQRIHRALRDILEGAIARRGTTFRDYRTGTGDRGENQRTLKVYGRGRQPCLQCARRLVTTHAIDGRATTFCVTCQGGATL